MKRIELTTGAELAYQKNTSDSDSTYGIRKAIVLEIAPYKEPFTRYRTGDDRFVKTDVGNGVLVEIDGRKQVVQLSQLVGLYSVEMARREQYEADRRIYLDAQAAKKKAHKEAFEPALKALQVAIKEAGITKYIDGWTQVDEFPVELLEILTAALNSQKVGA